MKLNRKHKLILTGVLLVVMTVGTTFAWWTASTSVKQEVKLGDLKIEADFDELADNLNYEPGLTTEQLGRIKNTGSIDAIIKVENESKVKFADTTNFVTADKEAIQLSVKPNGGDGYWYRDDQGATLLILGSGETAKIIMSGLFSGDKMDNEYMNAQISLGGNLKATQVLEGAMLAELGVNAESLTEYDDGLERSSLFKNNTQSDAMLHLRQLLDRGK